MAEATVEDAVAALCDPANRTGSPPRDTMAEVNGDKVLESLRAKGAHHGLEHDLVRLALEQIGGEDVSYVRTRQGLGSGAWREARDHQYVYLVSLDNCAQG